MWRWQRATGSRIGFILTWQRKLSEWGQSITSLRVWDPITEGFQDTAGKIVSKFHLGSLFHQMLRWSFKGLLTWVVMWFYFTQSEFFAMFAFKDLLRGLWYSTHLQFDAFLSPFNKHAFSVNCLRVINTHPNLVCLWLSSSYPYNVLH